MRQIDGFKSSRKATSGRKFKNVQTLNCENLKSAAEFRMTTKAEGTGVGVAVLTPVGSIIYFRFL